MINLKKMQIAANFIKTVDNNNNNNFNYNNKNNFKNNTLKIIVELNLN